MPNQINKLIINSPYEKPKKHWKFDDSSRSFELAEGRRPAGYIIASGTKDPNDRGTFVPIDLANQIRNRVEAWEQEGCPGITSVTRELLSFWKAQDLAQPNKFFFCQLEAIQTLIWLTEVAGYSNNELLAIMQDKKSDENRKKLNFIGDGGDFPRICSKMATGSGKTVVMAMVIAWQTLNKVSNPQDSRFSTRFFIVAPNLTVKDRLCVLLPSSGQNFYDQFNIVPVGFRERLNQAKVVIKNWQALGFEDDEKASKRKGVDKRGAISDKAYARQILGDIAKSKNNIVVINDEAHHAWRVASRDKHNDKEALEEATKWIGGLDRLNRVVGIRACFDFTATPFWPSGKSSEEEDLFPWIVSDFGLNDAIESGLVKTPQVVIRDDSKLTKDLKSRLYHIYMDDEVRGDLSRKADENEQLPDLVTQAYNILGSDWLETKKLWEQSKIAETPPVMISVVNKTETAARVKNAFDKGEILIKELCNPDKTLRIDSKLLKDAEEFAQKGETVETVADEDEDYTKPKSKKQVAVELREKVNTVGKKGKPGEQIQNVISVAMLSEGWDTKTVTHIMGLRAFSSQLLCEQVVGRGLRRVTYDTDPDGLFTPEYVNVFGVPFQFLPFEGGENGPKPPKPPPVRIAPDDNKAHCMIEWPNVIRFDYQMKQKLSIDFDKSELIELNSFDTPKLAELGLVKDGRVDQSALSKIDLKALSDEFRLQKIIFEVAKKEYEHFSSQDKFNGLFAQIVKLVEKYINKGFVKVLPSNLEDELKRITIAQNMSKVINHIWTEIQKGSFENVQAVLDPIMPYKSTAMMYPWYTRRTIIPDLKKNHINFTVYDSAWEGSVGFELERNEHVLAWTKNDHLGFSIFYIYHGIIHSYYPDFLVKLTNGKNLIIETKGQKDEQDIAKFKALASWCEGVTNSGLGNWSCVMCENPAEIINLINNNK
jgi:type III restriction enzyme